MKHLRYLFCLVLLGTAASNAFSQATATARRLGTFQVGGGVSIASPDYGPGHIEGYSVFADFDFLDHIGVEAVTHQVSLVTPTDIGENTYLIGPRYFRTYGRFSPYAKLLVGLATFNLQFDYAPHTSSSYIAYALGGGLDIRATEHINVRAIDFEAQRWPGFAVNGLTPYVTTVGVAYNFH